MTSAVPTLAGEEEGARTLAAAYRAFGIRLIPFLFICYLFNYLDRVNVSFAKLQMLRDLGMSEAAYGFGAGIFFLGYIAFGAPSNVMLNRVGARRWIATIMVAWGLLSTSLMFVTTPATFYILRILTGAAEAGFFPGIVLYLTRWFPPDHQGRVMTLFMSAIPVSGLLGSLISGWILDHFAAGQAGLAGWQWLFLLQGLPTVALGLAAWFVLVDTPGDATWLSPPHRAALAGAQAAATAAPGAAPTARLPLPQILRLAAIWRLGLIYFTAQLGVYAVNFWLPSIIRDSGITDYALVGLLSAFPYLLAVLFMIALGRSADARREHRWHLAIPLGLGAIGLAIATTAADSQIVVMTGMSLATMGALAALPMFWPLATLHLRADAAVIGIALINSTGQIAGFASPFFIGWMSTLTGSTRISLLVLAGCMLVGALLALGRRGAVRD